MTNNLARVLAAAGVAFACGLTATNALAAAPVHGARYVGSGEDYSVKLKVARNGRSLVARESTLRASQCGSEVHLGSRAARVHVSPSGRFRYLRAHGRVRLRASGLFKSRNIARVRVAYWKPSSRGCRKPHAETVSLERVIPFRCRTYPGKTVLEGSASRVFLTKPDDLEYRYAVACQYSANKRVDLGLDIDGDPDVGLYRLAGPYVAYMESSCEGLGGCLSNVFVRDLRSGKKTFEGSQHVTFGDVSDLALKETGAVAWIAQPKGGDGVSPPGAQTTLWASDRQGFRVLDSGDGIGAHSLELEGSTLSWVKDGAPRTGTLD
jgi:hypothetical protein